MSAFKPTDRQEAALVQAAATIDALLQCVHDLTHGDRVKAPTWETCLVCQGAAAAAGGINHTALINELMHMANAQRPARITYTEPRKPR